MVGTGSEGGCMRTEEVKCALLFAGLNSKGAARQLQGSRGTDWADHTHLIKWHQFDINCCNLLNWSSKVETRLTTVGSWVFGSLWLEVCIIAWLSENSSYIIDCYVEKYKSPTWQSFCSIISFSPCWSKPLELYTNFHINIHILCIILNKMYIAFYIFK